MKNRQSDGEKSADGRDRREIIPIHDHDRTNGIDIINNGDVISVGNEVRPERVVAQDVDVIDNDNDDVALDDVSLDADGSKEGGAIPVEEKDQGGNNMATISKKAHRTELHSQGGGPPTDEEGKEEVKIGFSFSPGGLLFAYHLGVLASLTDRGYVTESTPLAGSSAGGIAVATYAAGVNPYDAIASCIRIADECSSKWGGARGRLLPLLERELDLFLPEDAHVIVNDRPGLTGIAYREVFPQPKSVLATHFDSRGDLIEAICNSSAFPFFSSNNLFVVRRPRGSSSPAAAAPAAAAPSTDGGATSSAITSSDAAPPVEEAAAVIGTSPGAAVCQVTSPSSSSISNESSSASDTAPTPLTTKSSPLEKETPPSASAPGPPPRRRRRFPGLPMTLPKSLPRLPSADDLPRLVVDGFFATSRDRFGCPSFPPNAGVTRTVTVSVFPHHVVGLNASDEWDRICPTVRSGQRGVEVMSGLLQKAGIPSRAHEYVDMYECGRVDADRWVAAEMERNDARGCCETEVGRKLSGT